MRVAQLLGDGANPNALEAGTNGTALMIAATVGQVYVCSLLLDAGAMVDQKHPDFGMTALLWACNNAHVKCVELLVEHGADKNATEVSGAHARHYRMYLCSAPDMLVIITQVSMAASWRRKTCAWAGKKLWICSVMALRAANKILLRNAQCELPAIMFPGVNSVQSSHTVLVDCRSAARTKRMSKIVGDDGSNSLAFLQTSEQLDRGPATTAPTKIGVLETSKTH